MSGAVKSAVSLLIIDDDSKSRELLSNALALPGLQVFTAACAEEGLALFGRRHPQIVVASLRASGTSVRERIAEIDPATEVVVIAPPCSAASAVESLRTRIARIVKELRKRQCALPPEDQSRIVASFDGVAGRSPRMWMMLTRVVRVAQHYRTLLITGETGTGKDLVARSLHALSPAFEGRYVVLNCSAVVETLFESELFGHVKGSFTGATCDKAGLFEHAHGGTLFLDEIGDMPLTTQAKLLRVLEDREVQRVGALGTRKVDVRVIAATNHNLRAEVAEGRFREDLYYRLSRVEIEVPRLADRAEDLLLLQRHFIARFAAEFGKEIRGLTQPAQALLARHEWPGNVRELENVLGCASMMTATGMIDVRDLPEYLQPAGHGVTAAAPAPAAEVSVLEEQERLFLKQALEASGGNQSRMARILHIGRDALRYKLRKHSLAPPAGRASATAG
jgi:DNA-binding NtrC family response regulator